MTSTLMHEVAATAAFMGKGFHQATYIHYEAIQRAMYKEQVGEAETIIAISTYAIPLERVYAAYVEKSGESPTGVWAYEVPEVFGYWFGKYMVANTRFPTEEECHTELWSLMESCFDIPALKETLKDIYRSLQP